jgi:hypothetical protein
MSPIFVTYIGFFVAALILVWAVFEMSRRLYRRRKVDARMMNSWAPLKPSSPAPLPSDREDEEKPRLNHHPRSQQNGHYSESKKN